MSKFSGGLPLPMTEKSKALALRASSEHDRPTDFSPSQVYIPLSRLPERGRQTVREGERVLIGQVLAQRENGLPCSFASVAGVVRGFCEHTMPNGRAQLCAEIENDRSDELCMPLTVPPEDAPRERLLGFIDSLALVGMGGAGFETARKYRAQGLNTVLINGCECEPYLVSDRTVMTASPELVISGAKALMRAAGAAKVIVCVESGTQVPKLQSLAREAGLEFTELPMRYPQGGERQLIKAVLGIDVPAAAYPSSVGVAVSNVSTAAALGQALKSGMPPTSRLMTVSGQFERRGVYRVPEGTPARELISAAGGLPGDCAAVFGGAMTGRVLDEDTPVTLCTSGLLALRPPESGEQACIRCGGCVRVCPAEIEPFKIDAAMRLQLFSELRALRASECISCGLCSYICPAKRELTLHTSRARREGAVVEL